MEVSGTPVSCDGAPSATAGQGLQRAGHRAQRLGRVQGRPPAAPGRRAAGCAAAAAAAAAGARRPPGHRPPPPHRCLQALVGPTIAPVRTRACRPPGAGGGGPAGLGRRHLGRRLRGLRRRLPHRQPLCHGQRQAAGRRPAGAHPAALPRCDDPGASVARLERAATLPTQRSRPAGQPTPRRCPHLTCRPQALLIDPGGEGHARGAGGGGPRARAPRRRHLLRLR